MVTSPVRRPRARLDQLLVERGLAPTRSHAQALVLAGRVRVGNGDAGRRDLKPGDQIHDGVAIELLESAPFVSRGGEKLAPIIDRFGVDPAGRVCLDVGASTGGFTDVLLQRGARRVYALDVGRGQLAERLRTDPRVIAMDRKNARELVAGSLPEIVDLVVADVSFISLRLILEPVLRTTNRAASDLVLLVKPQFEAGRGGAARGVVRDPAIHRSTVSGIVDHARALDLVVLDIAPSPLLGPAGNREFFLHLRTSPGLDGTFPSPAELDRRIREATGG